MTRAITIVNHSNHANEDFALTIKDQAGKRGVVLKPGERQFISCNDVDAEVEISPFASGPIEPFYNEDGGQTYPVPPYPGRWTNGEPVDGGKAS